MEITTEFICFEEKYYKNENFAEAKFSKIIIFMPLIMDFPTFHYTQYLGYMYSPTHHIVRKLIQP